MAVAPASDLHGRVALVTGGGRGIGRAIALRLARAGMRLGLVARSRPELEAARDAVRREGADCLVVCGDVASPDTAAECVNAVVDCYGRLDLLVNNAGGATRKVLSQLSLAEIDEMVKTNVTGVAYVTCAAWRHLETTSGTVISISSMATHHHPCGFGFYSATKSFVDGFTCAMAKEGRRSGIRAYAVAPSFVDTRLRATTSPEIDGGDCLVPDDVAGVVMMLCDGSMRCASGQVLRISA